MERAARRDKKRRQSRWGDEGERESCAENESSIVAETKKMGCMGGHGIGGMGDVRHDRRPDSVHASGELDALERVICTTDRVLRGVDVRKLRW